MLQKVFKKAFFTRRKLGRPASSFFSNEPTNIEKTICFQPQLPSDTFLRNLFIPVLRMHLKRRGTHGCLLLIKPFIFESELHLIFELAAPSLVLESYGWSITTGITRVQAFYFCFLKKHIIVNLRHKFLGIFLAAFDIFGTPFWQLLPLKATFDFRGNLKLRQYQFFWYAKCEFIILPHPSPLR